MVSHLAPSTTWVDILAPSTTWVDILESRLTGWVWLIPGVKATANCIRCDGQATIHFCGPQAWGECPNCGQHDIVHVAIKHGWILASDIERLLD